MASVCLTGTGIQNRHSFKLMLLYNSAYFFLSHTDMHTNNDGINLNVSGNVMNISGIVLKQLHMIHMYHPKRVNSHTLMTKFFFF